jgi:D-amino-acid oxidase
VLVLGCGVVGLSSAIRLREAGAEVTIWARDLPPHTTSNIAAAIWGPYKAFPFERVLAWGERTFAEFCRLAEQPEAGIVLTPTIQVLEEPTPDPWWRAGVRDFRHAEAAELPPGYADGYLYATPVIEMGIYLPYLMRRFQALGGTIVQRSLESFAAALDHSPVVINCTGLGARELAADQALYAIRGQIIRVRRPAGIDRALLDEAEHGRHPLTYIVPRSDDCILGGVAEIGQESLDPDPATAAAILARASALEPALGAAEIIGHFVGLRPGRDSVRLEVEPADRGTIIHNYGHGGAGVTLSWGCADEVVALWQALGR